jgi:hypothetical protein
VSRRDVIRMSEDEVLALLDEERTMTCATIGPRGRPHLVPLWYVVLDGVPCGWTYASSQKAKNLERLPEATVQVEAGERYDQLRGVTMECDVELVRDPEEIFALGWALTVRYGGEPADDTEREGAESFVRGQAGKRVGLRFRPTRTVSWDHRKLAGGY